MKNCFVQRTVNGIGIRFVTKKTGKCSEKLNSYLKIEKIIFYANVYDKFFLK